MSETIKRYLMRPYVTRGGIASVEMEEHRSGGVVHYVDHLAALESARAEAFRMGQESMRDTSHDLAVMHRCGQQCIYDGDCTNSIAKDILNLTLKDKP